MHCQKHLSQKVLRLSISHLFLAIRSMCFFDVFPQSAASGPHAASCILPHWTSTPALPRCATAKEVPDKAVISTSFEYLGYANRRPSNLITANLDKFKWQLMNSNIFSKFWILFVLFLPLALGWCPWRRHDAEGRSSPILRTVSRGACHGARMCPRCCDSLWLTLYPCGTFLTGEAPVCATGLLLSCWKHDPSLWVNTEFAWLACQSYRWWNPWLTKTGSERPVQARSVQNYKACRPMDASSSSQKPCKIGLRSQ